MKSDETSSGDETAIPRADVVSFARKIAHDLRNDLNALELEATLLEEAFVAGTANVQNLTGFRETIRSAEQRLRKMNAKLQPLVPVLVSIRAEELVENLRVLATEAGLTGERDEWAFAADAAMLRADVDLLSDALLEILENASALRSGANPFTVRTITKDGDVRISISETKPEPPSGMAMWGAAPFTHSRRGTYGLGLDYARRIVEAHGGRIERSYHREAQILETTLCLPQTHTPPPATIADLPLRS